MSSRNKPEVVTLCGSSRFPDAFAIANMHLTMQGKIVISLACFGHADYPVGSRFLTSDGDETTPEKKHLDTIHFRKIDISDSIFVVNPGGYVGSSTKREIAYRTKPRQNSCVAFPAHPSPNKPHPRQGGAVVSAVVTSTHNAAGRLRVYINDVLHLTFQTERATVQSWKMRRAPPLFVIEITPSEGAPTTAEYDSESKWRDVLAEIDLAYGTQGRNDLQDKERS